VKIARVQMRHASASSALRPSMSVNPVGMCTSSRRASSDRSTSTDSNQSPLGSIRFTGTASDSSLVLITNGPLAAIRRATCGSRIRHAATNRSVGLPRWSGLDDSP